jgi:hypothetical protein
MFRAFGKKVAAIFGIGPDIAFDLLLTNGWLGNFVRWKLEKLFAV